MKKLMFGLLGVAVILNVFVFEAMAKEKLKIGVLYSITGSFALAGAEAGQRGTLIALDMWNDKGGVGGKYELVPVISDAQSNPDMAIREVERLISVEKVPIILGVYSSSIAVPIAPICEENKTILWITISISDKVVQGRHLTYVFRPQPMGSQWGNSSVDMLNDYHEMLGVKSPSEIKVACIYEDGPYGTSVQKAIVDRVKKYGMKLVHHEGYNHKAKDLSSLVLKLKQSDQDVILHCGYYPDIVLFIKQARELGLKTKALIGHGGGYANFTNLQKQLGKDLTKYIYDIDPAPAQNFDLSKMPAATVETVKEFLKRYNEKYKESSPPAHATNGFGHAWMLLKTLDYCVENIGDPTPDNIKKAALELKFKEGTTPSGYGMDFAPPQDEYAGQNKASYPVVLQWINENVEIVWPKALRSAEPKLPMPKDNPLAAE